MQLACNHTQIGDLQGKICSALLLRYCGALRRIDVTADQTLSGGWMEWHAALNIL